MIRFTNRNSNNAAIEASMEFIQIPTALSNNWSTVENNGKKSDFGAIGLTAVLKILPTKSNNGTQITNTASFRLK